MKWERGACEGEENFSGNFGGELGGLVLGERCGWRSLQDGGIFSSARRSPTEVNCTSNDGVVYGWAVILDF